MWCYKDLAIRTTLKAHPYASCSVYGCTMQTRARPPNKINIAFEFIQLCRCCCCANVSMSSYRKAKKNCHLFLSLSLSFYFFCFSLLMILLLAWSKCVYRHMLRLTHWWTIFTHIIIIDIIIICVWPIGWVPFVKRDEKYFSSDEKTEKNMKPFAWSKLSSWRCAENFSRRIIPSTAVCHMKLGIPFDAETIRNN